MKISYFLDIANGKIFVKYRALENNQLYTVGVASENTGGGLGV